MVLQAFMDESEDDDGTLVLAGHIAPASSWALFTKEWEELLPFGTRAANGKMHFKMSEMATLPERLRRVPAFYKILEKHVALAISCSVRRHDLNRAKSRLFVPNYTIDWDFADNVYRFAFYGLLNSFHKNRNITESVIPTSEPVDFIFDERIEKKPILEEWDGFIASRPQELKERYGSTPRFENDQRFLPLQAADFWAWWVRKRWNDPNPEAKLFAGDFDTWTGTRDYPKLIISYDEARIVQLLAEHLQNCVPSSSIYDHNNPFPKWK